MNNAALEWTPTNRKVETTLQEVSNNAGLFLFVFLLEGKVKNEFAFYTQVYYTAYMDEEEIKILAQDLEGEVNLYPGLRCNGCRDTYILNATKVGCTKLDVAYHAVKEGWGRYTKDPWGGIACPKCL